MAGLPGNAEDLFTRGLGARRFGGNATGSSWYALAADRGHVTAIHELGCIACRGSHSRPIRWGVAS